jgi:para-nitrobenzyl esterase
VLVAAEYRLGIFGFLSLPELTAESPHHTSGNYAILDLTAALEWVKHDIAAFGGDPDNVTIAGQSAGAFNSKLLCTSLGAATA